MFGMDLYLKHYPRKGKEEASAYYYWYLYMQILEGYGPTHCLWEDFGDVQMPFWDWWHLHEKELFRTGEKFGVLELRTDSDIQKARSNRAYMVRIDPECTREYLIHYFREFLDEKDIRKGPGRRVHQDEVKFAKYPFYQRPDVKSLRISYEVWKLRHQQKPRPTLYEIGIVFDLSPQNVINEKVDAQGIKTSKRNGMNAMVSRYLRWAETILLFIGAGIFPKNKLHSPKLKYEIPEDEFSNQMVAARKRIQLK